MTLVIWRPVSEVNSLLFVLIDIPAVWAIHRGLLALQGYYLYVLSKRGQKIPIARSRIPIVAGELLRGQSRMPSFFVLFYIAVLFCLLFATLGVDADVRSHWERELHAHNMTSLAMPNNASTTPNLDPPISVPRYYDERQFTCRRSNGTHAQFWPTILSLNDSTSTSNEALKVNPLSVNCQAESPHSEPMLEIQCINWNRNDCSLESKEQMNSFSRNSQSTMRQYYFGSNHHHWVEEHRFTGLTSRSENFRPNLTTSNVRAFVWRVSRDPANACLHNRSAILFYHTPGTNHSLVSLGNLDDSKDDLTFNLYPPLRIPLSSEKFLLYSCRTNQKLALFMISGPDVWNRWPLLFFEEIFERIIHIVPVPNGTFEYRQLPPQDVTVISNTATVLYAVLIILAIALYSVKELLIRVSVRRGSIPRAALFVNDFDELSKMLRAVVERTSGVVPTGKFADWEIAEGAAKQHESNLVLH